ncbi:MAG: glutamine amidotransferase [Pirellulaceae bacterium]
MSTWSLNPVFDSYTFVIASAAVLLLLLLVVRHDRSLSWRRRFSLRAIRLAVILLVVLGMLRPTHVSSSRKSQSAVFLILVDLTESMLYPGSQAGVSRWEEQRDTIRASEPSLRVLHEGMNVKVYGYTRQLQPLDWDGNTLGLPEQPTGQQTDIGTTLYRALEREMNQRLAGVVLMGDGTQTTFDPEVEIRQVGQELERLGIPLYAVPFGDGGTVQYSRDIAVQQLPQQYTVYVKNQLAVRSVIRIRGYVNQQIPVQLILEKGDGTEQVVQTKQLTPRRDDEQIPVEMTYIPQQPGQYTLRVRAAKQDGELLWENNELASFLTVREGGLRVLYLYGSRIGEQLELRRSIASSPYMEVVQQYISLKGRNRWPDPRASFEADEPYDVILIENLNSRAIGKPELQKIATAVETGTGLMMIGGYHSFGPGEYYDTDLDDVLPVEMFDTDRQSLALGAKLRGDLHLQGDIAMQPVRPHMITTITEIAMNKQQWSELPPLLGANRLVTKDTGRVLLASGEDEPLLVAGDYGAGRVLAFAGDSTWRWRREGFGTELQRFWRQSILWLAHRDEQEHHDIWVRLPQRRVQSGMDVPVIVGVSSSSGEPVQNVQWTITWEGPDGIVSPLDVSQDLEQWLASVKDVRQPGSHKVTVTASIAGTLYGPIEARFQVLDDKPEKSNPVADIAQLGRLVHWTESYGGRLVEPRELPVLLQELGREPPELDMEVEVRWQLGKTRADAWAYFLLIVVLVSSEWYLRKKWGMV